MAVLCMKPWPGIEPGCTFKKRTSPESKVIIMCINISIAKKQGVITLVLKDLPIELGITSEHEGICWSINIHTKKKLSKKEHILLGLLKHPHYTLKYGIQSQWTLGKFIWIFGACTKLVIRPCLSTKPNFTVIILLEHWSQNNNGYWPTPSILLASCINLPLIVSNLCLFMISMWFTSPNS